MYCIILLNPNNAVGEAMIDITKFPLVRNEEMNQIHFEEVEIMNRLSDIINSSNEEAITKEIQVLIDHMQMHFSFEEALMQEKNYNMLTVHQGDHNKVLNQTRYILMDWRSAKDMDRIKEYFQEELVAWLDQHIKAMDTPMSEFLDAVG
jgi:hemerythrin